VSQNTALAQNIGLFLYEIELMYCNMKTGIMKGNAKDVPNYDAT